MEFRRSPDGSFTVADVGSLNGTYVNRERSPVALSNGDEVLEPQRAARSRIRNAAARTASETWSC
ncbi:hypothetical protein STENM223S_00634 [Streptomyces tendae]